MSETGRRRYTSPFPRAIEQYLACESIRTPGFVMSRRAAIRAFVPWSEWPASTDSQNEACASESVVSAFIAIGVSVVDVKGRCGRGKEDVSAEGGRDKWRVWNGWAAETSSWGGGGRTEKAPWPLTAMKRTPRSDLSSLKSTGRLGHPVTPTTTSPSTRRPRQTAYCPPRRNPLVPSIGSSAQWPAHKHQRRVNFLPVGASPWPGAQVGCPARGCTHVLWALRLSFPCR